MVCLHVHAPFLSPLTYIRYPPPAHVYALSPSLHLLLSSISISYSSVYSIIYLPIYRSIASLELKELEDDPEMLIECSLKLASTYLGIPIFRFKGMTLPPSLFICFYYFILSLFTSYVVPSRLSPRMVCLKMCLWAKRAPS